MPDPAANPPQFYPPHLDPLLTRLCQSVSYPIAHLFYRLDLKIDPASIEKFRALGEERIVLLPNHPTFNDGIALFLLSTRLGQLFHYLVAYDSFKGFVGKFIQRVGGYSIRRGVGDRYSVAQTLELLRQPACRLVIFPEGGCSFQNDIVMPFRSGAIQLPFQAMSKVQYDATDIPNFYLVPVSLKYRYQDEMNQVIDETLLRLERALKISPISRDFYPRLRAVAEQVLVQLETEYGVGSVEPTQLDWNQRIERLKVYVLTSCEQALGITPAANAPVRERVYKIQSLLEADPQELAEEVVWTDEAIYKAAVRLLNFDAIYDGYVAAAPTPERFLDTLTRLEREVFSIDQPLPKGQRQVIIQIGDPVNLRDHFAAYKQNRVATVEALTQHLQAVVQTNLDQLNRTFQSQR